jgi:catechol 2,3-dioxygenase-like lactoylglutathione lyase family enzyme
MIIGMHAMMYSPNADAVRAFLRDVLGFSHVDAGGGWLIFKAPPAELAAHPSDGGPTRWDLGLMCDNLEATLADLAEKGVAYGAVEDVGWGRRTMIALPDHSDLMLYEPRYQTAF